MLLLIVSLYLRWSISSLRIWESEFFLTFVRNRAERHSILLSSLFTFWTRWLLLFIWFWWTWQWLSFSFEKCPGYEQTFRFATDFECDGFCYIGWAIVPVECGEHSAMRQKRNLMSVTFHPLEKFY
jgi:hypothetical protein